MIVLEREQAEMSEPFHQMYQMCREGNTPGFRFPQRAMSHDETVNTLEKKVTNEIRENTLKTKMKTYVTELNSPMTKHKMYDTKTYSRLRRESLTRVRVMAHMQHSSGGV